MYATIRRYRTYPDSTAEIAKRVEEGFVPIIRKLPGFIAYYVVDDGDGLVASISFHEDKTDAENSNNEASKWVKENKIPLVQGLADTTVGEVIIKSP